MSDKEKDEDVDVEVEGDKKVWGNMRQKATLCLTLFSS